MRTEREILWEEFQYGSGHPPRFETRHRLLIDSVPCGMLAPKKSGQNSTGWTLKIPVRDPVDEIDTGFWYSLETAKKEACENPEEILRWRQRENRTIDNRKLRFTEAEIRFGAPKSTGRMESVPVYLGEILLGEIRREAGQRTWHCSPGVEAVYGEGCGSGQESLKSTIAQLRKTAGRFQAKT